MIVLSNLRELFVQHKVVRHRDRDETHPARGTIEMEAGEGQFVVVFRKHPDDTVYMIGEEGENILAVSRTRRVCVPLAFYGNNTPENLERSIQDRLYALIEAIPVGMDEAPARPTVPADQVVSFLTERFGSRGLAAVILAKNTAEALPGIPCPAYLTESAGPDFIYGIAQPQYLGHIAEDTTRHGDEPLMDEENLTPFPSITRTAMCAHGGVIAVHVKR